MSRRSYISAMNRFKSYPGMFSMIKRSMCKTVSFSMSTPINEVDNSFATEIKITNDKITKNSLNDEIIDEQYYLNEFEKFTKEKKYIDAYNETVNRSESVKQVSNITSESQTPESCTSFENELKLKSENTILESIQNIDTTNALKKLLNKTNLIDLTGEIQKIIGFVKVIPFIDKAKKDATMTFLMSLDFLVKGLFTHWQISLLDESESVKSKILRDKLKEEATMIKYDIKYNILIGDQFHAKAYHMTSMLGNNELCKILATIEESFSKILFRNGYDENKTDNLKKLYKDFYNYLPILFGHGFKGVAVIYEMGTTSVEDSFKLGIEYGFCIQFGIFSYIISAISNSQNKAIVKEKLKKISCLVQFISVETLEEILKSISIFRYNDLKFEFTKLSLMHGKKCYKLIDGMNVSEEIKIKMKSHISEFSDDLVKLTGFEDHTSNS